MNGMTRSYSREHNFPRFIGILQLCLVISLLDSTSATYQNEHSSNADSLTLDQMPYTITSMTYSDLNHRRWKEQHTTFQFTSASTRIVDAKVAIESLQESHTALKHSCKPCGDQIGSCGQCSTSYTSQAAYCNDHGLQTIIVYYWDYGSCHDCGRTIDSGTCSCYAGFSGTLCETPNPTLFPTPSPTPSPTPFPTPFSSKMS